MKAILPCKTVGAGGVQCEEMRLFDTETATELCGIKNDWGNEVKQLYISPHGILFTVSEEEGISVGYQEVWEKYLGKNHPDIYERIFGKVKEG